MAGIKVKPNEYADLTISFLLDAMMKPDEVLADNEEFHEIITKMERAGLKSQLMRYYLNTSSITRGKYKIVRKSLTDEGVSNNIYITKDTKIPKNAKTSKIKDIVKKTLKVIKAHKLRKNSGMPLNEKVVDKIIDKIMENEEYNGNV
ncbi:MAG: hypothetical protein KAS32_17485 [Candidatus Peribacteraceae bacterium]|nr:hypothetical protein [Candidatus Peribacteraceae bacterium]